MVFISINVTALGMVDDVCSINECHTDSVEANAIINAKMEMNGIITNSEVWYNIKENHLVTLEEIDQMLLRKVFKAHSKTAIEALYLEAGIIPIRFIIAKRRLMYLWTILRRNDDEVVKKVFDVRKVKKTLW